MAPEFDDFYEDDDLQDILFERLERDLGILIEDDFDYDDEVDYTKYRHRDWDHF